MTIINVKWDTLNKSSNTTLSDNDLTAINVSSVSGVRSTTGKSKGKWYCEFSSTSAGFPSIGIVDSSIDLSTISSSLRTNTHMRAYTPQAKVKYPENIAYGTTTATVNMVYSILLDLDTDKLEFWANGVSQGISHTDLSILTFPVYIFSSNLEGYNPQTITVNFGATAFVYTPPTGYLSYDYENTNKFLIKQNTNIYTYNGTNIALSPSQTLDDNNFKDNGFRDSTSIPESLWGSTFTNRTNLQLLYWTDDTTIINSSMIYNTNPYKPFDKFGENKVTGATFTTTDNLTYTVNPTTNIPFKKDSVIAYENGAVVTPSSIDLANGKIIFSTARTGVMTFDYTWINKFNIMMYKAN